MKRLNEYEKREVVGDFYKQHCSKGKSYTVNHFLLLGMKRATVYRIISRVEENMKITQKHGSGTIARKGFQKFFRPHEVIHGFKRSFSVLKNFLKHFIENFHQGENVFFSGKI